MDAMILDALAESNRLQIVELLREGPHSVGEISERLSFSQPQASKHLRVLSQAGIVKVRPIANRRVYQLQPEPFQKLYTWLNTFHRTWEGRLDALEVYLRELQTTPMKHNRKRSKP